MRVIAGIYRGRILKSPADNKTRPTSDRLRETLFNILAPRIDEETRFLDLCAGTGAMGIEALSRGAAHVTFVDRSRRACALIEESLDNPPFLRNRLKFLTSPPKPLRQRTSGWLGHCLLRPSICHRLFHGPLRIWQKTRHIAAGWRYFSCRTSCKKCFAGREW